MKLKIEINMDNAAFGGDQFDRGAEAAKILEEFADKIAEGAMPRTSGPLRDSNGNLVGTWSIEP